MITLSKPLRTPRKIIGDRAIVYLTSSKPVGQTLHRSIRSAALVCLIATGLTALQGQMSPAMASATAKATPQRAAGPKTAPKAPAFRAAVNAAMQAAQLSQTAKTAQDWQTIVQAWELAIAQMNAVPPSDSNATIAQGKAVEYSKNLDYARQALARQAPAVRPSSPTIPNNKTAAKPHQAQPAKTKQHVVQQSLTANPLPALLQVPLQSLQTNPWLGKGSIVLAAATGLVGLLTLEMKPKRARKTSSSRRDREAENIFFTNIGKGVSGVLAQLGDLPLQPSPGPLKSDKVQRKLFRKLVLLAKDEATAVRLIKGYLQRHPEHSMDWCCEKAILDLQQSA
jgi:hypothetical protein